MEELSEKNENDQVNQQEIDKQENKSTLLKTVSIVYVWIGKVLLFAGGIIALAIIANGTDKDDIYLSICVCAIAGGLFTLFAGCIGEAIDDIRASLKK